MKKYFAMFALAAGLSAGAQAATYDLTTYPGFTGGTYGDFTYDGKWVAFFDAPIISFYDVNVSTLTYDAGTLDFSSISLNGRPWDGYGSGMPPGVSPTLTLTFKGLDGGVLATKSVVLEDNDTFNSITASVHGVHSIDFSIPAAAQYFVRVASVSAVPEAETYAMMLAGLGLLAVVRRKRQA
ncbi:PEP-CTERM sorting domain-containing protein [Pseudoduganella sp. FT55W]|uniref:PEP-CTERM sorting domain-containing protein n=1 Tax=Duganella rivi TaxID=2666083 RepID=A0A7X4K9W1_9BURK|nr:PEP-CTERM sorting domain-containing protein [Duganella rivi]MYM65302.1 PEP-CTERM sorting domain-containing protein [Duganella rivi]